MDSADVWSHPEIFQLDENLEAKKVAGVPPDAFSDLGQRWGNPLYDWKKLEKDDFSWWRKRMEHSAKLYDIVRIDHFIGMTKYYTIPAEDEDARNGKWEKGPGMKLIKAISEATGDKKIIAEELGEECASLYGLCSSFVHPSTNDAYKSDCFQLVLPIYELLKVEYENLPKSKSSLSLDFAQTRSPVSDNFYNLMSEETSILCSVANVFDQKFGNNYVSNTFRTIGYILPDLAIEKQLGLTEQTKCKWKIVVELCATFDYIYVKFFGEELRFRLLDLHGQVQGLRNINKEYDLDEAYQVYCQIYKRPCDRERFEEGFKQPLGYLIDQNGSVPSLTKVVCEFIKNFESKNESGISVERAMLLDYMESQMISHANGYMWFANSGAFSDTNNIFKGIDISLMTIFRGLHTVFLTHCAVEESKEYKSIINILRNSRKKLKNNFECKASILALPMAHKWHVS